MLRQDEAGQWEPVIERVRALLTELAAGARVGGGG
jgi:hypothetical protein